MANDFKSKMQKQLKNINHLNADTNYESSNKNIELRDISLLTELPENDLIPPLKEDDFKNLFFSIQKEMHIRTPMHVSRDNVVLCGNNRLHIAKELGISEVPVIVVDIPKEKYIFYAIEDNLFRRQLNDAQKADLILQLKPAESRKARARSIQALKRGESKPDSVNTNIVGVDKKNDLNVTPEGVKSNTVGDIESSGKTTEVLAKKVGISASYLKQYEKVKKENPLLAKEVREEKLSVNKAYKQIKKPKVKTTDQLLNEAKPYYIDHGILIVKAFKYNFNRPNKLKRNRLIDMLEDILGMLRYEKEKRERL